MNRLRTVFLLPAWAFTLLLFLGPLLIIVVYSLETKGVYGGVVPPWTLENYARLLDPLYGVILLRSLLMAAVSTFGCIALAFPLAAYIARSGRRKTLLLNLVMLPFWTSFLVRTYAWMFLLRDTGLINSALLAAGLITEPLPLLYNDAAVIVGLIYGYLPFAVLPLYSNLERLDKSLFEAAADLGARPWQTLLHIVLPLTAPGLRAAGVLVFIPCLGAYLTPDLLGGGKSMMIGNLVQNQFTSARDWPFGSALSLALMAIVMLLLWALLRRDGGEML
jgi:spermidine/putrescine transport system permease protein